MTEYALMRASGLVQESWSGTTHVALPPAWMAFASQAPRYSVYVEFDVPHASVRLGSAGWAKIIGPRSLEGRLAARMGRPVPRMPAAANIVLLACNWRRSQEC